ncbi:hypothetical protein BKA57DRAFT_516994 [Linnemannia elongata]|nr:hypothetical protein BKA57DRAFT_516994 [Linnemannia elongata]
MNDVLRALSQPLCRSILRCNGGTHPIAYHQGHDLSLFVIYNKIHAVATTGEVAPRYFRRLPWVLVSSFATLTLHHRQNEGISSLPEIPTHGLDQLQLAVGPLGSIPSEREIHNLKSWHLQTPGQEETPNELVMNDPGFDITSVGADEGGTSSTFVVPRRLPDMYFVGVSASIQVPAYVRIGLGQSHFRLLRSGFRPFIFHQEPCANSRHVSTRCQIERNITSSRPVPKSSVQDVFSNLTPVSQANRCEKIS